MKAKNILSSLLLVALILPGIASAYDELADCVNGTPQGVTGSTAAIPPQLIDETNLPVVNISAPGQFLQSNVKYVLTQDIDGGDTDMPLMFGQRWNIGITNAVIDLNGHTLTFDNGEKKDRLTGIFLKNSNGIVVKNGTIIQGKGQSPGSVALAIKDNTEVTNVRVITSGDASAGISSMYGKLGGLIHDNYIENQNAICWSGYATPRAINVAGGYDWDIFNNIVVGGHSSIVVSAVGNEEYDSHNKVHHNKIFATKRAPGFKAPHGIEVYANNFVEIYENQIVTYDARGINVQAGGGNVYIHNNTIDARYTTIANNQTFSGAYNEDNNYGYWQRAGENNQVYSNIFIVADFADSFGSNVYGAMIGGGSGDIIMNRGEICNNTFKVDLTAPTTGGHTVNGFFIKDGGPDYRIYKNKFITQQHGYQLDGNFNSFQLYGNTFVKNSTIWSLENGSGVAWCQAHCDIHDNQTHNFQINTVSPTKVSNVRSVSKFGIIELAWNRNPENDVLQYNIYRDGTKINIYPNGAMFFIDRDIEAGRTYSYQVSAINLTGVEGIKSNPASVTAGNQVIPPPPPPPPSSLKYGIIHFVNLVQNWRKSAVGVISDVNEDSVINIKDLGMMMSKWE